MAAQVILDQDQEAASQRPRSSRKKAGASLCAGPLKPRARTVAVHGRRYL